MSATIEKLREEIHALPKEDREALLALVIEDVEEPPLDFYPDWDAELDRRSAELRSGKVEGIPWEEVKRQIDSIVESK
jgi:putative addiction module component (TIGR02574 family)